MGTNPSGSIVMFWNRWLLFTFALAACMVGLVVPALARDDKPVEKSATATFEVEKHKDLPYRTDKEADKERHKLDVYCPKGQKDFPVVLFVHGGSWRMGNKSYFAGIGEEFAKTGIGFVICNYRLSPNVQHPAHIQDVAKAFAWTRENIGKYGGKNDNLFVCGHSAGGHLVSLLATDPEYLKVEKRSPADIKGVISISGVYKIDPSVRVFNTAFGKDEDVCKQASPLTHVTGKHPPFLIAYAEDDYPTLEDMAKEMHAALKKAESPSELIFCKRRNHISIITSFILPDDSLNKAVHEFVLGKGK
jgi:acetyl esterase/lipase